MDPKSKSSEEVEIENPPKRKYVRKPTNQYNKKPEGSKRHKSSKFVQLDADSSLMSELEGPTPKNEKSNEDIITLPEMTGAEIHEMYNMWAAKKEKHRLGNFLTNIVIFRGTS